MSLSNFESYLKFHIFSDLMFLLSRFVKFDVFTNPIDSTNLSDSSELDTDFYIKFPSY